MKTEILIWALSELAVSEPEQIETGVIEVLGEDGQGREGSAEFDIFELANEAVKKIQSLISQNENLKEKIKDIGYSYRKVEEERDELRILKFKRFNEEECWLYRGDGEDYLDSLVCPVVISPERLITIKNMSAEGFKNELIKASAAIIHPHIEGVYAVWENNL
tara:strand:+ start:1798 stop:2286 length:489 start_codon:yes stop_codon:yes gene_type:complete